MAVGDSRYSAEQKAAVIAACIDGPTRRSVPEVLRLAAAGGLKNPENGRELPAFDGNIGTFRDYVARELRARRREVVMAQGGDDAARILAARLNAVGEREIVKLERKAARGKASPADVRAVAAMARDLLRLSREAGLAAPTDPTPPTRDNNPGTGTLADDILAAGPTGPKPIV